MTEIFTYNRNEVEVRSFNPPRRSEMRPLYSIGGNLPVGFFSPPPDTWSMEVWTGSRDFFNIIAEAHKRGTGAPIKLECVIDGTPHLLDFEHCRVSHVYAHYDFRTQLLEIGLGLLILDLSAFFSLTGKNEARKRIAEVFGEGEN